MIELEASLAAVSPPASRTEAKFWLQLYRRRRRVGRRLALFGLREPEGQPGNIWGPPSGFDRLDLFPTVRASIMAALKTLSAHPSCSAVRKYRKRSERVDLTFAKRPPALSSSLAPASRDFFFYVACCTRSLHYGRGKGARRPLKRSF